MCGCEWESGLTPREKVGSKGEHIHLFQTTRSDLYTGPLDLAAMTAALKRSFDIFLGRREGTNASTQVPVSTPQTTVEIAECVICCNTFSFPTSLTADFGILGIKCTAYKHFTCANCTPRAWNLLDEPYAIFLDF